MTTTNPFPNVAPPPGASFVDDWQFGQYRMVRGAKRDVAGEVEVWTSAAQCADGTVDADGRIEPPLVHVRDRGACGLTVEQARELADAILDAINDLDGWAKR
jgi:hypothetical protein